LEGITTPLFSDRLWGWAPQGHVLLVTRSIHMDDVMDFHVIIMI
jgi:hypothetical protein